MGKTLAAMAAVGLCALPISSEAAWPTKVLTAAEQDNTFDVDLSLTWDRSAEKGRITREWIQDGRSVTIRELEWRDTINQLLLELRVGLYHDLEFHVIAPIILSDDSTINFAEGVSGASTLFGANPNANDPTYAPPAPPRFPTTPIPAERNRNGFGDMTFGLAWSPINDAKDEAYPTLTLKGDIIAPTGKTRLPSDLAAANPNDGGGVGRGMTIFDLSIGLSKRMRDKTPAFDPYMLFGAQIPVATGSQQERGVEPAASGRFTVGTDLIVYERASAFQRYALDLSFTTRYIGQARTYSELSDYLPNFNQTAITGRGGIIVYDDYLSPANYANSVEGSSCGLVSNVPCGEYNRVEEYVELSGTIAAMLKFAEYAFVRTGITIGHKTDHFLTNEKVGEDLDGSGRVEDVNASNTDERSPYFDPRYDTVGRRLRLERHFDFTFFLTGVATF